MLGSMMLSDVDFTPLPVVEQGANFSVLLIFPIGFSVVVIMGIIVSMVQNDDKKSFTYFLICVSVILALIVGVVFSVITIFNSSFPKPAPTDDRVAVLKDWAEENYLVGLNDHQAIVLLNTQIDLTDANSSNSVGGVVVKDGYGNLVQVQLVKVAEGEWELVKGSLESVSAG